MQTPKGTDMRPYYSGLCGKLVGSPRAMRFGECQQISTHRFPKRRLTALPFLGEGLLIPDFPRCIVLNHTHATALTFESVQSLRRVGWYLQSVAIRIK